MHSDIGQNIRLVDHHCHGVVAVDLTSEQSEDAISEAYAPAPAGTSHWDKPVALSIRRWCAPVLDLPKFSAPVDYIERRRELVHDYPRHGFGARAGGGGRQFRGRRRAAYTDFEAEKREFYRQ